MFMIKEADMRCDYRDLRDCLRRVALDKGTMMEPSFPGPDIRLIQALNQSDIPKFGVDERNLGVNSFIGTITTVQIGRIVGDDEMMKHLYRIYHLVVTQKETTIVCKSGEVDVTVEVTARYPLVCDILYDVMFGITYVAEEVAARMGVQYAEFIRRYYEPREILPRAESIDYNDLPEADPLESSPPRKRMPLVWM